jgi:hypothetical protein
VRLLEAISTSTVTCISLDRWHLNGNGKGGVETAVRGREEQKSRDQIKAWLRFRRLVLRVFDWVDGRRRRAYDKAQLAFLARII